MLWNCSDALSRPFPLLQTYVCQVQSKNGHSQYPWSSTQRVDSSLSSGKNERPHLLWRLVLWFVHWKEVRLDRTRTWFQHLLNAWWRFGERIHYSRLQYYVFSKNICWRKRRWYGDRCFHGKCSKINRNDTARDQELIEQEQTFSENISWLFYWPQVETDKAAKFELLQYSEDILTQSLHDLKSNEVPVHHCFDLKVDYPIWQLARRLPPKHDHIVKPKFIKILKAGVIFPATSARSFPVIIEI